MSVDRNGRSHKPKGLPKGVAGTYDRVGRTKGDDDLQTDGWRTTPTIPRLDHHEMRRDDTHVEWSHGPTPIGFADDCRIIGRLTGMHVHASMRSGLLEIGDTNDTHWTYDPHTHVMIRRNDGRYGIDTTHDIREAARLMRLDENGRYALERVTRTLAR